jgi:type II secretory pathway pseudopilin PulG
VKTIYGALGIILILLGSHFYAYQKGVSDRKAEETEVALVVAQARQEAALGAADAIAKIEITNKTIYQKVQHEVLTNTVYVECKHNDVGMQLLQDALKPPNKP